MQGNQDKELYMYLKTVFKNNLLYNKNNFK